MCVQHGNVFESRGCRRQAGEDIIAADAAMLMLPLRAMPQLYVITFDRGRHFA